MPNLISPQQVDVKQGDSGDLYAAIQAGDLARIEALIEGGLSPNVEFKDRHRNRPLHVAALTCERKVIDVLIKRGARKELKNKISETTGYTPYQRAPAEARVRLRSS